MFRPAYQISNNRIPLNSTKMPVYVVIPPKSVDMRWDEIRLPAIDRYTSHPSKHDTTAGLMFAQRLGRWANIKPALADLLDLYTRHLSISGPE